MPTKKDLEGEMLYPTIVLPAPAWIDARVRRIRLHAILDAKSGNVDRARAAVKYLRLLSRWMSSGEAVFLCDSASAVGEINAEIGRSVIGGRLGWREG